jgi:hypothetical protein
MDRRTLLQLGGMSFIGLQLGLLAGCERQAGSALSTTVGAPDAGKALRELGASLNGIEFVGPVCRQEFPGDDPASALLERLEPFSEQPLHKALNERIRRDHEAGERIDIGGWQLARTECMLLAVAAQAQGLGEPSLSDLPDLRFEPFADIERWGPQETIEGEIFNPIGNGRGGFWVRVADSVPGATRLVLDGIELATHFEPGVVTASLEPDYMDEVIANPGMYELLMVDTSRNVAQRVGHLTVRPMPPKATLDDGSQSNAFCEIERWGPDHAPQGQPFNEQPDGSAAFWVRIGCAPETAQLVLDDKPLPTTVHTGIVTARVPHYADLESGKHTLAIHDPASGEKLTIGILNIL